MNTEKELEKQDSEIRKNLLLVIIPIVIIVFVIGYYQSNSLEYNKKKYLESSNKEFNGIVIKKREEGDFPRAGRFIGFDDYYEERVSNEIYYKIAIGDTVFKKKGSDSVYFYLKSGEILIQDYNKYLRDQYIDLLNKK
ncbi:hypothetical protein [Flavobacterium sp. K5-23]|uniref:hypothetical protein n=1 Tax=Flavobacterium sp. K5-23 TaxID=2746225 RepID=UPI0020100AB9|nr:hypothetical protein [Flavobacterium sp. K5-23]UQD57169.1 hypothetical protein FLAK523_12525 [Flavobacterium sp. K5-23]